MWSLIGVSAAILTMFGFIPQICKTLKTKSVENVSLVTLLQLSLGVSFWIAYGMHLKDMIIITANSITLSSLIALLILYFYYKKIK